MIEAVGVLAEYKYILDIPLQLRYLFKKLQL